MREEQHTGAMALSKATELLGLVLILTEPTHLLGLVETLALHPPTEDQDYRTSRLGRAPSDLPIQMKRSTSSGTFASTYVFSDSKIPYSTLPLSIEACLGTFCTSKDIFIFSD